MRTRPIARRNTGSGPQQPVTGSHTRNLSAVRKPGDAGGSQMVAKRRVGRVRGLGLRTKFMLVLAVVTAVVLTVLGFTMARTSDRFLVSQKLQDGVEIVRLAAQMGTVVAERLEQERNEAEALAKRGDIDQNTKAGKINAATKRALDDIARHLRAVVSWGGSTLATSDILAVQYLGNNLDGFAVGEQDIGDVPLSGKFTAIYVPKIGRQVALPEGIEVQEGVKPTRDGGVPIVRFRAPFGRNGTVRLDIATASVKAASANLYVIIAVAVIAAILVVVAIANWLATTITKPLDFLLRDMHVVAGGNLGHQTRGRSNDEIGVLADQFNNMTQSLAAAQAAMIEQEKAAYELSLAQEVQRQLLPAEAPVIPGYECAAHYQGAKAVSGDYYDAFPLGNGLWGLIVADVSGKGVPGSMVMAVTRTILRLVAGKHGPRAAETLKETNRLIAKQIKRGMFVTAFYAVLDERSGVLVFSCAGHNPMLVYRAGRRAVEAATTKGIAIGFNDGPIFDRTAQEGRLQLAPGDAIVLYTDGYPEAMNESGEEYGEERFYRLFAGAGHLPSTQMIAALNEDIAKHRGAAEQSDDLTMLALRRTGA